MAEYYETCSIDEPFCIKSGPLLGIHIGRNSVYQLRNILTSLQCTCVGIIASEHCQICPLITKITDDLGINCDVQTVPSVLENSGVDKIIYNLRQSQCQLLIAVGESPAFDVAKVIAYMINPDPILGYYTLDQYFATAPNKRQADQIPVISIASSISCSACSDVAFIGKQIICNSRMDGAILDFEFLKLIDDESFKLQALALLHYCFEMSGNINLTPSSADYIKETVQILHKYVFQYIKNKQCERALYWISYAVALAGLAMSETIPSVSCVYDFSALQICQLSPYIVRRMWRDVQYPLQTICEPIFGPKPLTEEEAAKRVYDFHTHITAVVEYSPLVSEQSHVFSEDTLSTYRAEALARGLSGGLKYLRDLCLEQEY